MFTGQNSSSSLDISAYSSLLGGLFLHTWSLHLHIGLHGRLFFLQEQPFLVTQSPWHPHCTSSMILAGAGKIREVTGLSLSSSLYHPLSSGSGMVGVGVVYAFPITAALATLYGNVERGHLLLVEGSLPQSPWSGKTPNVACQ